VWALAVAAACLLWAVGARADTPYFGTVVEWGANWYGQTNVPDNATDVTQIAAGSYHTLALRITTDAKRNDRPDTGDLAIILLYIGDYGSPIGDLDGDSWVSTADVSLLLLNFGPVTWP
jgi:hypothetical protein